MGLRFSNCQTCGKKLDLRKDTVHCNPCSVSLLQRILDTQNLAPERVQTIKDHIEWIEKKIRREKGVRRICCSSAHTPAITTLCCWVAVHVECLEKIEPYSKCCADYLRGVLKVRSETP